MPQRRWKRGKCWPQRPLRKSTFPWNSSRLCTCMLKWICLCDVKLKHLEVVFFPHILRCRIHLLRIANFCNFVVLCFDRITVYVTILLLSVIRHFHWVMARQLWLVTLSYEKVKITKSDQSHTSLYTEIYMVIHYNIFMGTFLFHSTRNLPTYHL